MQQPNGVVNVYVGSEPLVLNTHSRGIAVEARRPQRRAPAAQSGASRTSGGTLNVTGGQIGALSRGRAQISGAVDDRSIRWPTT